MAEATQSSLSPQLRDAFGNKGLVDLLHLVGLYIGVSAFLNAFEVPVPQPQS